MSAGQLLGLSHAPHALITARRSSTFTTPIGGAMSWAQVSEGSPRTSDQKPPLSDQMESCSYSEARSARIVADVQSMNRVGAAR